MAKHCMYLSELYGRIGQMLREYGDAPIGRFKTPMFQDKPHLLIDYVEPLYLTFAHVDTQMEDAVISTYELIIDG